MGFLSGLTRVAEGVATGGLSELAQGGSNSVIGQVTGASSAAAANTANAQLASNANAFSAQQAQQQMDFQERMSDTAYQRATADMTKAGVNPMLAITQGGASTPGGAAGSPTVPTIAPVPSLLSGSLDTALKVASVVSTVKGAMASADAAKASALNSQASAAKSGVETSLLQKKGNEASVENTLFGWLNNIVKSVGNFSAKAAASAPSNMERLRQFKIKYGDPTDDLGGDYGN